MPWLTNSSINSWGMSESLIASLTPHFSIPSASHLLPQSVLPQMLAFDANNFYASFKATKKGDASIPY